MAKQSSGSGSSDPSAPERAGTPDRRLLSPTMEDYLEAIFRLTEEAGQCTVSALADRLGVKRPTVSKAIKRLDEQGFVDHEPYGKIGMTDRGREVARQQVRIHRVLMRFLTEVLKLPEDLAEHDTCLMEHAISRPTVERLVEFIDRLDTVIPSGTDVLETPAPDGAVPSDRRSWKSRV